jgi:hypothetical protein
MTMERWTRSKEAGGDGPFVGWLKVSEQNVWVADPPGARPFALAAADVGDRCHLTRAELGALLSRGSHLNSDEKLELRQRVAATDVRVIDG